MYLCILYFVLCIGVMMLCSPHSLSFVLSSPYFVPLSLLSSLCCPSLFVILSISTLCSCFLLIPSISLFFLCYVFISLCILTQLPVIYIPSFALSLILFPFILSSYLSIHSSSQSCLISSSLPLFLLYSPLHISMCLHITIPLSLALLFCLIFDMLKDSSDTLGDSTLVIHFISFPFISFIAWSEWWHLLWNVSLLCFQKSNKR